MQAHTNYMSAAPSKRRPEVAEAGAEQRSRDQQLVCTVSVHVLQQQGRTKASPERARVKSGQQGPHRQVVQAPVTAATLQRQGIQREDGHRACTVFGRVRCGRRHGDIAAGCPTGRDRLACSDGGPKASLDAATPDVRTAGDGGSDNTRAPRTQASCGATYRGFSTRDGEQ